MILKLHKNKIHIIQNKIPENVNDINIKYIYETGTNHLVPHLYINGVFYRHNKIKLDLKEPDINVVVYLMDTYNKPVHTYKGTFNYYKLCAIGTHELVDVYEELQRAYAEIEKLKAEGEVI